MRILKIADSTSLPTKPQLSPLTPRGLTSPDIESLSSYTCRLAKLHWMHPHGLATYVRRHYEGDTRKTGGGGNLLGRLNGVGRPAEQTAAALGQLLATQHARQLTLLPWRNILDPMMHGVFTKNLRYCPECIVEDLGNSEEPYIRLSWLLLPNLACHMHRSQLADLCPECKNPLKIEPWIPDQFFCMHCRKPVYETTSWPPVPDVASERDIWVSNQFADLIVGTHVRQSEIGRTAIINFLRYLVKSVANGDRGDFERMIGTSRGTARRWLSGESTPTLEAIARLSWHLQVSLHDGLLSQNTSLALRPDANRSIVRIPSRKVGVPKERLLDVKKRLKGLLKSSRPLPTMTKVCSRIGLSRYVVRYHYGDLYAEYMERSQQEKVARQRAIDAARVSRVVEGAKQLLAEGFHPSRRLLQQRKFAIPSDLRRPEVRRAVADLLRKGRD